MQGYDEDENYESDTKSNIKWVLIFGIMALAWYLFRGKFGSFDMDNLTIWVIIIVLLILFGKLTDSDLKNRSPKLISNPIHTTITGEPVAIIGGYAAFRAGGVNAFNFIMEGRDGTVIVPISTLTNVGKCTVANTRITRVPISELPDSMREEIENRDLPKPYYLGIPDVSQMLNIPESSELLTEIRHLNKENQMLKKQVKDLLSYKEGYTEHQRRMAEMVSGSKKSWGERVFGD